MFTLILSFAVSAFVVIVFKYLNATRKPPILGIYQQRNKGYWLKFIFMYVLLTVKRLINEGKRLWAVEVGQSSNGTEQVHKYDSNLEQKYIFGDHPKAVDAVYFNGLSKDGSAVVCGLARRPNHYCDAFLYLKCDGEDLLLSPNLPDTHLEQTESEQGEYSVQGIKITNFMPMRTWKLSYTGEMKSKSNPDKHVKVEVSLTWSAAWAPFNYDAHMSPSSMAGDLAREPWSREYFTLLEKLHQTHYEQMGYIGGIAVIDGKEHSLDMPCLRDRSFGPLREWRNFHRYVYHFMFLENGDCMAVGSVSEPTVLSHLTIGYLCKKADQSVLPVDFCDFHLYQHAENEILPKDYGFVFKSGCKSYAVKVKVNDEDTFYIGKDRVAKFYERWCSVEVNGIRGWACVEWHYNNVRNCHKK
ncbi:hypothetical protein RR46_10003 [Papilio xuthus]|uniref:Uncharacterized protein n=1 Tax=Papilio xuthus TaxID=66420 RepID=A0A194QCU1_PAPXU|nr:hypothetical protein RR46_10003 [Papilio xuthus]